MSDTTKSELVALKLCPFCGGAATLIDRPDGPLLVGAFVSCDPCNISTPIKPTAAEAIAAWNLRAAALAAVPQPSDEAIDGAASTVWEDDDDDMRRREFARKVLALQATPGALTSEAKQPPKV